MMDVTLYGAFIAGVLSFLSPCVLPLVPPYLCYIGGASLNELTAGTGARLATWRVILASIVFVLGFSTVFVALGATASAIGQVVADYFDILGRVAGVVIIILGLNFMGVLKISTLMRDTRFHDVGKSASLPGAYLVGLAFAFGWTPCVGPVLAAVLFVASSEDTTLRGVYLLAAYSLGIGLPFIAAAFAVAPFMRFIRRFSTVMSALEKGIGVLLVVTGVLFLTGSVNEIGYWLLETFPALGRVG